MRSAILFVARLDLGMRAMDLGDGLRFELASALAEITDRAYRIASVTIDPDDARGLKGEGVLRRDYRHYLFGRSRNNAGIAVGRL